MAKYKASPSYAVDVGKSTVKFDYYGNYETSDGEEIGVLDGLAPLWITKVDEPLPETVEEITEETAEPEVVEVKPVAPARKTKASAK